MLIYPAKQEGRERAQARKSGAVSIPQLNTGISQKNTPGRNAL